MSKNNKTPNILRLLALKKREPRQKSWFSFYVSWEQRKFVDLYQYASEGGTPDTNNPLYYDNGKVPFVKIEDTENKYIDETKSYISDEGVKHSSAWIIPPNNVIFTNGATVGNVAINRLSVATKQGILGVLPSKIVTTEYLYYLLSSIRFQKEVKSRMATGTFATIILKNLNEIPVSIPKSVAEQELISKKLSALDDLITLHQRGGYYYKRSLLWLKQQKKQNYFVTILNAGSKCIRTVQYVRLL